MKDDGRLNFIEMTGADFKKLGLSPLHKSCFIKSILKNGIIFVYKSKISDKIFCTLKKSEKDEYVFVEQIKINELSDFTEHIFKDILCFSDSSTSRYLWLQKYIKGEVDGKYIKENDENLINLKVKEAVKEKERKIEKLINKISDLNRDLSKIKEENRELKEKLKRYEKFKKLQEEISKIQI